MLSWRKEFPYNQSFGRGFLFADGTALSIHGRVMRGAGSNAATSVTTPDQLSDQEITNHLFAGTTLNTIGYSLSYSHKNKKDVDTFVNGSDYQAGPGTIALSLSAPAVHAQLLRVASGQLSPGAPAPAQKRFRPKKKTAANTPTPRSIIKSKEVVDPANDANDEIGEVDLGSREPTMHSSIPEEIQKKMITPTKPSIKLRLNFFSNTPSPDRAGSSASEPNDDAPDAATETPSKRFKTEKPVKSAKAQKKSGGRKKQPTKKQIAGRIQAAATKRAKKEAKVLEEHRLVVREEERRARLERMARPEIDGAAVNADRSRALAEYAAAATDSPPVTPDAFDSDAMAEAIRDELRARDVLDAKAQADIAKFGFEGSD